MRSALALLPLALVLACSSPPPTPSAPLQAPRAWQPAAPRSPLVLDREDRDPNVTSALARGSRTPLAAVPPPPPGAPVLELPDGTRLPALNGVAVAAKVQSKGLVPAVVAIVVDGRGFEWYEHLDGALTSCRYVWRANVKRWDAVTAYAEPAAGGEQRQ